MKFFENFKRQFKENYNRAIAEQKKKEEQKAEQLKIKEQRAEYTRQLETKRAAEAKLRSEEQAAAMQAAVDQFPNNIKEEWLYNDVNNISEKDMEVYRQMVNVVMAPDPTKRLLFMNGLFFALFNNGKLDYNRHAWATAFAADWMQRMQAGQVGWRTSPSGKIVPIFDREELVGIHESEYEESEWLKNPFKAFWKNTNGFEKFTYVVMLLGKICNNNRKAVMENEATAKHEREKWKL